MSNKTEDNVWKSSLDRFGDDLTELILSYLPISEKIRLECTSKQVQSLIFNKQKCLRISHFRSDDNLEEIQLLSKTSCYKRLNCRAFGTVLKKCKNLDTIRIEGLMTVDSELIDTIAENLRQLKILWITVPFILDITNDCLKKFVEKCGSTLQTLKFDGLPENQMRKMMSSLPELRSVTVDNIKTVITEYQKWQKYENSEEMPKFLPKLQEIQFNRCDEQSLNQLQTEYSDNLLKISGKLFAKDLKFVSMTRALAAFGRFQRLQSLSLFIDNFYVYGTEQIPTGLKQLAQNSLQLKQLSIELSGDLTLNNEWFSILSEFKSLSYLKIKEMKDSYSDLPFIYGSFRQLKHLTQLKHLDLTFKEFSDSCIENIDKYLPQLESIRFSTSKFITDKSLTFLSQMKYLSKLTIICFTAEEDHNITDIGVKKLFDGCPRMESLILLQLNTDFDFNITEESIKAIILRSKRMPKIKHLFSFSIKSVGKRNHLRSFLNNLPQNISIIV